MEVDMSRKRYSPKQIITMLWEAAVLLNQATSVVELCLKLGISEQTYYPVAGQCVQNR